MPQIKLRRFRSAARKSRLSVLYIDGFLPSLSPLPSFLPPETAALQLHTYKNGDTFLIVIGDLALLPSFPVLLHPPERFYIIKPPALARNSYQIAITDADTGWINYYRHEPT